MEGTDHYGSVHIGNQLFVLQSFVDSAWLYTTVLFKCFTFTFIPYMSVCF